MNGQKTQVLWAVGLGTLLLSSADAMAQERYKVAEGLTAGLSVRERYEVKEDFRFDNADPKNDDNYLLSQIRLNLQWDPSQAFSFYVEGQDSRVAGEETFSDDAVPNTFADSFDLHQAYVDWKNPLGGAPTKIRLGRQKLRYGQERLVGPLEWVNTARMFDAAVFTVGDVTQRSLDAFVSHVTVIDPDDFNDWSQSGSRYANSDFHGLYYTDRTLIEQGVFEGYYLLRHEDVVDDRVSTLGVRFEKPMGALTTDGEFAYQFGDFGGVDHRAFAVHAGLTWLADAASVTKFNAQYNYATGDDNSADDKHETFDNLYPTNHGFYGYMDFFSWQNMHNVELSASRDVMPGLTVRAAWHNFWLAEPDSDAWYGAGLGVMRAAPGHSVDSYVGNEFDLTVKYPFLEKRLWAEVGYSHFFAGGYVDDTGASEDADFLYTQLKFAI